MISTSTLILRTRVTLRWIAIFGFAAALILIVGSGYLDLLLFIFPA